MIEHTYNRLYFSFIWPSFVIIFLQSSKAGQSLRQDEASCEVVSFGILQKTKGIRIFLYKTVQYAF